MYVVHLSSPHGVEYSLVKRIAGVIRPIWSLMKDIPQGVLERIIADCLVESGGLRGERRKRILVAKGALHILMQREFRDIRDVSELRGVCDSLRGKKMS